MSAVFDLADRIVEESAAHDPIAATYLGVAGYDGRLTDYGPDAADARAARARAWLAELAALPRDGADDRLAAEVIAERLGAQLAVHDKREHLRDINILGSPVQAVRGAFTMMPTETEEQWATIAERLASVPACLATVRTAYERGIGEGLLPARRQVLGVATVAEGCAGVGADAGWFSGFVAAYAGPDEALRARLEEAARGAESAYADLAAWLRSDYAAVALERDAVGPERYRAMARVYTGADLDLEEAYTWGWAELGRITARMREVAGRLYGGVTPAEAMARLDEDPVHTIEGAEATRDWLQRITDETIASFDGRYFDIPEPMRRCEAVLAPPGAAAAPYYTGPSEDFARPGRTWLPVLPGQTRFRSWWLLSVWFHEAVPGHHLQVAYTMLQRERLSRFQRVSFVSGHGEGWALYAERLMDELGYFDEPATELGFLSAQAMRAVRVIVDIGLHLELAIPADTDSDLLEGVGESPGAVAGRVWDPDLARRFLHLRGLLPEDFAASEVDRYLGLPGQAISYKLGERVWLAAREDARAREGAAFDLKAWHMRALALGSVGLDVLRAELARAADTPADPGTTEPTP
jgi:uncharacterized protein (DUF885 family)